MTRYGILDLALALAVAGINFSILGWMFFRLEIVWARNGSLDLYWNFIGRIFGWNLLAYLVYLLLYQVVRPRASSVSR